MTKISMIMPCHKISIKALTRLIMTVMAALFHWPSSIIFLEKENDDDDDLMKDNTKNI
jgi:hypothetical protein